MQISLSHRASQCAHAQDVLLTRSHGNGATGIQQVEGVRGLEDHLVTRQWQLEFDQAGRFAFVEIEQLEQLVDVGVFEVVGRLLNLVLMEHIAVGDLPNGPSAQTRS